MEGSGWLTRLSSNKFNREPTMTRLVQMDGERARAASVCVCACVLCEIEDSSLLTSMLGLAGGQSLLSSLVVDLG